MLPVAVTSVLFGQDIELLRSFLFGTIEIARDSIENEWSLKKMISHMELENVAEESWIEDYKSKATDLIDRSYKLLTSGDWTEVKTTENGDKISYINSKHGKIMKIEGVIDAPASELLDCMFENVEETPTWNKHVMEMKKMQIIDQNTDIVYQSTKSHGGGIIGPRDFITLRHRGTLGNYYISSGVSINCLTIPMRKNFVRGENGLICFATESIEANSESGEVDSSPGKCRFTWILNTNLKGWLPRTVIDKSLTIALTEFMAFLRYHVHELTQVSA